MENPVAHAPASRDGKSRHRRHDGHPAKHSPLPRHEAEGKPESRSWIHGADHMAEIAPDPPPEPNGKRHKERPQDAVSSSHGLRSIHVFLPRPDRVTGPLHAPSAVAGCGGQYRASSHPTSQHSTRMRRGGPNGVPRKSHRRTAPPPSLTVEMKSPSRSFLEDRSSSLLELGRGFLAPASSGVRHTPMIGCAALTKSTSWARLSAGRF